MEDGRPEGRRGSKWLYRPGLDGGSVAVGVVGAPLKSSKSRRACSASRRERQRASPMDTKASNEFEG